jgi:uncharacterized membrane protein YjjP (DUF1212 family)
MLTLLTQLTRLLLRWSYEGTAQSEAIVKRVAARYGATAEVAFLPDAAVLTVDGQTATCTATPIVPPLHQISALKRWLARVERGDLDAAAAARELDWINQLPVLYGRTVRVVGLMLFSVGFGISIQATWQEVAASALLGLAVGLLVVATEGRTRAALLAPFAASVTVSAVALVAFEHGWIDGGPIQLMLPALFFFIPGDALAAAMLELADGRITAGASRLVYSLAILLMLGFGTLVATVLVDVPQSTLFDVEVEGNLGPIAVWSGWLVFAGGVLLCFSMAPADFPWALGLVLLTASAAAGASAAFGDPVGTFVAAIVMTAVAILLGRRPGLPPPYVLYLGAFYVLTPGSHGLRGIESWIGGNPIQGVTGVADMLGLLTAIALGMLVGAVAVGRPAPGHSPPT